MSKFYTSFSYGFYAIRQVYGYIGLEQNWTKVYVTFNLWKS